MTIENCAVYENVSLKGCTTMRIGGTAKIMAEPLDKKGVCEAVKTFGKYRVLGNGSNLLICDGNIETPIIKIGKNLSYIETQGDIIKCGGGTLLSALATAAAKESLTGLEFAHGIPGSVGGAVRMNAGAYGGEMKDVVKEVEFVDENGVLQRIDAKEADFSYRKSVFTNRNCIVTEAVLELSKGDSEEIRNKMQLLMKKRRDKQPLEYPSAGSTFKRPEGHFAAALIEEAGLKGMKCGGAAVSAKHAGFIINEDNATYGDVADLIDTVKKVVFEKSGVMLETEVEIWK